MERDIGLRRTALLTGALVAVSAAGTVAVGVAAHAADSAGTPTVQQTSTESDSNGSDISGNTDQAPSLSGTGDGGGQATSGGS
jgi:hypothetical protein